MLLLLMISITIFIFFIMTPLLGFLIAEKNKKELIKDIWFILTHSAYWVNINNYSPEWDKLLNIYMSKYDFVILDKFTASLGDKTIWIANHPYGSFTPYDNYKKNIRPKRRTVYKAMEKLIEDSFKEDNLDENIKEYLIKNYMV